MLPSGPNLSVISKKTHEENTKKITTMSTKLDNVDFENYFAIELVRWIAS